MNTHIDEFASNAGQHVNVFGAFLDAEALKSRAPAVFAGTAHESTSPSYAFLSTQKVLEALDRAGFRPVQASQTASRKRSPLHARHLVRLRRTYESIELRDSIPELVLTNSHDGSAAYLMLTVICHHSREWSQIAPDLMRLRLYRDGVTVKDQKPPPGFVRSTLCVPPSKF